MNTIKPLPPIKKILKSKDVLRAKNGKVFIVIDCNDKKDIGKYIMKIDSDDWHFVSLSNGELWNECISDYTFELVTYPITLTPNN